MAKVSIIVPVYNVEQYIARCIESIIGQSFRDIELIIVNDCTPDSSMSIVEKYAVVDNRIKIINHEVNRGLMRARQTGYLQASGDYITFCDSDDTLPHNAMEILYKTAIDNNADIVSGNLRYINVKGKENILSSNITDGGNKIAIFKDLLNGKLRHNLCSKLFRASLLHGREYLTYDHFTNGEDGCLFYQVVENCNNLVQISDCVYDYYQNTESSSQERLKQKGIASIVLLNEIRQEICQQYPELKNETYKCISRIMNHLLSLGYKNMLVPELKKHNMMNYINIGNMLKMFPFSDVLTLIAKRNVYPILYQLKR